MSAVQVAFEPPGSRRIAQRRNAVVGLYCLSAFWGVAQVAAADNTLLHVLSSVAYATLATLWFTLDRRILARPSISILQFLFFVTWPVASLIYLAQTRGLRGIALWGLHALGMLIVMCLTFFPTAIALYWLGFLDLDAVADP